MLNPTDPRVISCIKAALSWIKQHNVKWLETERKIYSREHKFAGTMDGLAYVSSCGDPACCATSFKDHLSIIDWKSSNYLYLEFLFQTAAYLGAFTEEFPDKKVTDRFILRLGKEDGEFEPWHLTAEDFPADYSGYLECLALYRKVELVEERMKGQKKSKREIKKSQKAAEKAAAQLIERDRKAKEKAKKKAAREVEKARVKAEAKTMREAEKAAAKATKLAPKTMPKLETLVLSPEAAKVFVETITNPPAPNEALKQAAAKVLRSDPEVQSVLASLREEAPVQRKPFIIPEEG
jgi:hypothetical protein